MFQSSVLRGVTGLAGRHGSRLLCCISLPIAGRRRHQRKGFDKARHLSVHLGIAGGHRKPESGS